MAAGWSVVLEERTADKDVKGGKALLYYHRQIDDLAERLGLTALSHFFSRDPQTIAAYMRSLGIEPDLDTLPDEEWFDAAEGLATVRGLLAHLRDEPNGVPEPSKIIADLEVVVAALAAAEQAGSRFHLGRELSPPEREG
jgi:hypothetical protein